MIRWIGSVGTFRRVVMKQELCQTSPNIACATSTVTRKRDHSHTSTHAHTTLIQMAMRTRLTCRSELVCNQTVSEISFAVHEFPSRLCYDHDVSLEVGMTACTHVEMGSHARLSHRVSSAKWLPNPAEAYGQLSDAKRAFLCVPCGVLCVHTFAMALQVRPCVLQVHTIAMNESASVKRTDEDSSTHAYKHPRTDQHSTHARTHIHVRSPNTTQTPSTHERQKFPDDAHETPMILKTTRAMTVRDAPHFPHSIFFSRFPQCVGTVAWTCASHVAGSVCGALRVWRRSHWWRQACDRAGS